MADEHGRYPAIALDADKRPVDSVTSGMGHLLGTGLLDAAESRLVADRLLHPGLADGYGLRTYATGNGGYNPLGYHVGSIWPHDTAIAVHGLARAGFSDHARRLAESLIAAAPAFDSRLPELFAGTPATPPAAPPPTPPPAAPRPGRQPPPSPSSKPCSAWRRTSPPGASPSAPPPAPPCSPSPSQACGWPAHPSPSTPPPTAQCGPTPRQR